MEGKASQGRKVSVIIPSYRGSERLVRLVKRVASLPYEDKEVVVVVDEPLREVAEELRRIGGVKLILRPKRGGKVSALNEALRESSGEVVIFLDDDVYVEDDRFIEKVLKAMEGYDIADIKKVIVDTGGILSKLVYIEYASYNFASKLMARAARRTVAVNGAAFAVRRKALDEIGYFRPSISEDFDIALRSFKAKHNFTYIENTYVLNYPPSDFRKWFKQRKRWAIGLAAWLEENFADALKTLLRMPHAVIPGLLLALPSLSSALITFVLSNHVYEKTAYLFMLTLSSLVAQALPFASILLLNIQLIYLVKAGAILTAFFVFLFWQFAASRAVKMKSYLYLYPVYFFVYQPLWLTILLAGFIRVIVLRRKSVEDWVV